MLDLIKSKLEALGCEAWEITEILEERWEFYFIGHRLDQNRSVRTRETQVKVYVKSEDGKDIGSASDTISPTENGDGIDRILDRLLYQAGAVKNPYYTITDKPVAAGTEKDRQAGENSENNVRRIAGECIKAMSDVPEGNGCSLNSYEIFVSSISRHMLNSNGVEFSFSYPSTEIEVVINARDDTREIELHRIYNAGTCNRERLASDIGRVMQFGTDRLKAVPTPDLGSGTVMLSSSDAVPVYEYFADRMQAEFVVRGISSWKIGEAVAAVPVTLEAVKFLEGSSTNFPVDREGNEVYDRFLIRDGIAENYCGSRQFSQYLGLDQSSLITNIRVKGGSHTAAQLRSDREITGDYLEVVEFSDFQVDPMSGDIAGEIRLGYWHHGNEMTIVTGGSVSGSMNEAAKDMLYSSETVQYNNRIVPEITLLKNMRITGGAH